MTNLQDLDAKRIEDSILYPQTFAPSATNPAPDSQNPFASAPNSAAGATHQPFVGSNGAPTYYGAPMYSSAVAPSTENLWAIFAHLGGVFLTWLVPLIIWLVFRDRSWYIADQAKEALNFQITLFIGYAISIVLAVIIIGAIMAPVIGIMSLVFAIMAAVAASRHQAYRYPFCIRFIK